MANLETLQTMSGRRQLALAFGVLIVLCVAMIGAYFLFFKPTYTVLFSKLRPADAAAIVGELDKKKIPFQLADDGATILVPERDAAGARVDVLGSDLPLKGGVGFELFNKSDMGLTEFAQKINYLRALQGELARTIMSIEGIETARVHLSMSEPTIFKSDRIPPKASVTITTGPGLSLTTGTVRGIQRMVAAAVPELDTTNVVILDDTGRIVSSDAPEAVGGSPYLQQKAAIEAFETARIREQLQPALGPGQLSIAVWADFSTDSGDDSATGPGEATRDYRLVVTLTPHRLFTDADREEVIARTARAIGFKPDLGDVISFAAMVSAAHGETGSDRPAVRSVPITLPAPASGFPEPNARLLIPLGIGVILLFFGLDRWAAVRRRRRRSRLIARFETLLDQEGGERLGSA